MEQKNTMCVCVCANIKKYILNLKKGKDLPVQEQKKYLFNGKIK